RTCAPFEHLGHGLVAPGFVMACPANDIAVQRWRTSAVRCNGGLAGTSRSRCVLTRGPLMRPRALEAAFDLGRQLDEQFPACGKPDPRGEVAARVSDLARPCTPHNQLERVLRASSPQPRSERHFDWLQFGMPENARR